MAFILAFFLYAPWKPHKPEIETPKIGGYIVLAQNFAHEMKQPNSFRITA